MADEQPNNPLHGITLKALLTGLVEEHGWEYLGERVRIQCFQNNPSIKSSLTFLRKTPWARAKVEALYLSDYKARERKRKRNLRRAARRAYAESVKDGTAQVTAPGDEPTPIKEPKPVKQPEPVKEPEPVREPEPIKEPEDRLSGWSFDR